VSELGKRWAVAGVGVPVVIWLLYLGVWPVALVMAALAGMGAKEVYRLAASSGAAPLEGIGVASAAALVLLAAWNPTFVSFAPSALGLVGALVVVSLLVAMRSRGPDGKPLEVVAITVFGALYAGLSLAFVPMLRAMPTLHAWVDASGAQWGGVAVLGLPLAATWIGDAIALFAGRAWGKGGLAPTISPKKSWVGVWAGLAGAAVAGVLWWAAAGALLPQQPVQGPLVAAAIGVLLGIGAIVGDLAESLLKRGAGVKDSGAVFPGHGGVLDRLDALTFTLPMAYVALALLQAAV
jgi:phosphatidate cytidylyltransferase